MNKLIRGEMLSYDFIEQNGLRELCDWLQSIIKARYDMCHSKTNCNKCALKSVGCSLNETICAVDDLLKAVYEWREDRGELDLIKEPKREDAE